MNMVAERIPAAQPAPSGRVETGRPAAFRPIRAIVRKEIAESLKFVFAGLGVQCLVVGLYAYNNLYDAPELASRPIHEINALFDPAIQAIANVFCIASGVFLAIFQIFNERTFDLRAFFRHRAVSSSGVFAGKAIAGLILYFIAIGLSLALFIIWAATSPKSGPVFDMQFTRIYVLFFLNGIAFYFATLVAAQRQARWYVSRVFPLGAAIVASICTFGPPLFWQALLGVLLIDVLLVLAAWNCYIHSGIDTTLGQPPIPAPRLRHDIAPLSIVRRLALPLVMLVSLSLTACLLIPLNYEIFSHTTVVAEYHRPAEIHRRNYLILPNGLPAIRKIDISKGSYVASYFDLAGNLLPATATRDADDSMDYPRIQPLAFAQAQPSDFRLYSDTLEFLRQESIPGPGGPADRRMPPNFAFYSKTQCRFLIFDSKTNLQIGTVGASGFDQGNAQPFSGSAVWSGGMLLIDHRALRLKVGDLTGKPSVAIAFEVPTGQIIQKISAIITYKNQPDTYAPKTTGYIVDTDQNFYFFGPDEGTKPLFYLPIEHTQSYVQFEITRQSNRIVIRYLPLKAYSRDYSFQYVYTYTDHGELLNQATLPELMTIPEPILQMTPIQSYGMLLIGAVDSFRNPWLVSTLPWDVLFPHHQQSNGEPPIDLPFLMAHLYGLSGPAAWYYSGLLPPILIFAGLTLWLTTRYRFTWAGRIFWTLAALVFGPVGLLVLLFTQPLAARIACPNCKQKRLSSQALCSHCGAEFPLPEKNGNEIFATV